MPLTTKFRLATLALAAGLVAAPAAFAEQPPAAMQLAQDEQQQPAQPAIQPDEEQLESFVVATVRIINIQQQAQQQMQAAEPEQQEQVRAQALQEIVAAVENEGLSVDEYNGIVQQVENDPELGQTVQQRIQEEVGQSSGLLRVLDDLAGRLDERLFGYGLAQARALAWRRATALLAAPEHLHLDALLEHVGGRRRGDLHHVPVLLPRTGA